jgi:hypothetical protein
MRRLIFAALLAAAPMLTLVDSTPASACGWFGGYGYRGYAPRSYGWHGYRRGYAYTGARVYGWRGWGWRW